MGGVYTQGGGLCTQAHAWLLFVWEALFLTLFCLEHQMHGGLAYPRCGQGSGSPEAEADLVEGALTPESELLPRTPVPLLPDY